MLESERGRERDRQRDNERSWQPGKCAFLVSWVTLLKPISCTMTIFKFLQYCFHKRNTFLYSECITARINPRLSFLAIPLMLLYDGEPARCSVPAVMDAFVECWVRPTVHSTSGPVSQSVINEGGDGQAGCILITHKDTESYGKEGKRGNKRAKREEKETLCIDITVCVKCLVKKTTFLSETQT